MTGLDPVIAGETKMAVSSTAMMSIGDVIHSGQVNLLLFTIAAYQAA
jgi:hypothetical protein